MKDEWTTINVSGRHRLIHGNAMDLICDLEDHSIDLTIEQRVKMFNDKQGANALRYH